MRGPKVAFNSHRFRNSLMSRGVKEPALTVQATVINVNMTNWTVDVVSQFDRHWFSDIQVLSPYLHYNQGEGMYCMPEVGAVCMVTVPSDSCAPFVQGFLAPLEQAGGAQLQNPNDPNSQTTNSDSPTPPGGNASFAAGRSPANPGDIVLKTRDGNFLILHRGGVLSYGATELAQRICIPLGNKVLDISQTYEHQNIGGSVHWGIQEGPLVQNPAVQNVECYRVFANDQYADIRIAKGKVLNPIGEPDGDAGDNEDVQLYGLGTDQSAGYIVYEIAVAAQGQGGFMPTSGDPSDGNVRNQQVLRFFFDAKGNTFFRCAGSAVFDFHNKLKIRVTHDIDIECENLSLVASQSAAVGGTDLTTLKGNLVKFEAALGRPVAGIGDGIVVSMSGTTLAGSLSCAALGPSPQPCTFTIATAAPAPGGSIVTGNVNIQV